MQIKKLRLNRFLCSKNNGNCPKSKGNVILKMWKKVRRSFEHMRQSQFKFEVNLKIRSASEAMLVLCSKYRNLSPSSKNGGFKIFFKFSQMIRDVILSVEDFFPDFC